MNYPSVLLEYIDNNGTKCTAKLLGAGADGIGGVSPNWYVQNFGQQWSNQGYEYLTYLGTDGNIWKTRVTCSALPGGLPWLNPPDSVRQDGTFPNHHFAIVDWQGANLSIKCRLKPLGQMYAAVEFYLGD
jgi:hypothetical protein